jgi:hypothetical protein
MPFQAVPQGVQVRLLMSQNGVKMENVWNVDAGAAVTPTILTNITGAFDSWLTTNYSIVSNASLKYEQWVVTDISVANGAQVIFVPTTTNGASAATEAAGNAAFVASLRTAHTGRNFRGRTYVAGLNQASLTDAQHASAAFAAGVNNAFGVLLGNLLTLGYKLCVLSRFLNNALRAIGLLTEIVSIVTDTKIDSQQRRTAN